MHAPRLRLQQHSTTCAAQDARFFELLCAFFRALLRRAAPKNRTWRHNSPEHFDSPRSPLPQGQPACFNARLHRKHDNQAESLLGASVYRRTFLRDEHANIGPFEQPTARGTGHCRQTVAAVDLRATLAGSFCYNFSKMRGLQDHPLTAHLHVALGKAAHRHFAKGCLLKVHLQKI